MIGRLAAGGVVVLGCGYLGICLAAGLTRRVRQLEALEAALAQLSFGIEFLSLPLAEAIGRTAAGQRGVIRRIFQEAARRLAAAPQETADRAWRAAVESQKGDLCLKGPELEALEAFAAHLGQGGRADTLGNIRLTAAKLKLAREAAASQLAKDGRLYRGMGFLTGLLLALLLF